VKIGEIVQKIPGNARFGMIISVAIIWVGVIRISFLNLFEFLRVPLPEFVLELIIAIIVTMTVYSIFKSWTKLAKRISKIKVSVTVKPRANNNGKKRR